MLGYCRWLIHCLFIGDPNHPFNKTSYLFITYSMHCDTIGLPSVSDAESTFRDWRSLWSISLVLIIEHIVHKVHPSPLDIDLHIAGWFKSKLKFMLAYCDHIKWILHSRWVYWLVSILNNEEVLGKWWVELSYRITKWWNYYISYGGMHAIPYAGCIIRFN